MPRHDTANDDTTNTCANADVIKSPTIAVDTEEATSTDPIEHPDAEAAAEPGDNPAQSDAPADEDDESNDSTSSKDADAKSFSSDSSNAQIRAATARVANARAKKAFNSRFMQHSDHIRLTEDRIRLLEKRLDELEDKPRPPPSSPSLPPVEAAAIPELNFVDWATFKATRKVMHFESEPRYAIDVLLGEPLLFHQRHKASIDVDETSRPSPKEADNMPPKTIPDRIRINSIPLNEILKNVLRISGRDSAQPLVILRPYKALLHHEKDFCHALAALEKRWAVRSDVATGELDHPVRDDAAILPSLPPHQIPGAIDELRCLLRFVESLRPLIEEIRDFPRREDTNKAQGAMILFKDLWYVFQPGQYLFNRHGIQKVWRVIQVTGGRSLLSVEGSPSTIDALRVKTSSPLHVDCYYLDFDGSRFGAVHRRFQIRPFEGLRPIVSLDVHPIVYQANHEEIMNNLTKRGDEFVKLTRVSHKYFKGKTIVKAPDGERITSPAHEREAHGIPYPEQVESPVIVDFDRTIQINPDWCPNFTIEEFAEQDVCETLEMSSADNVRHYEPPDFFNPRGAAKLATMCKEPGCCNNEYILSDFQWDRRRMEDFVSNEEILSPYGVDKDYVASGGQLKLLPNRVFGFILRSRKWACLPLDCLRDVVKHSSNFDDLELTGEHKNIVVGLVDSHFRNKDKENESPPAQILEDQDFDLVRAKGRGLIILLHGAPGVGKTSTAECVAEAHGKPLFPITCGDLGVDPVDVEKGLEFNFQLAESWGCVLLLDEADVFLAQRGPSDLSRNALVSIFLRALEYYSGILFLTTNRVGTIDEAFRSRIHMSLYYPNLTEQQTMSIWKGHLKRASERDPHLFIEHDAILNYARQLYILQVGESKIGWNGRQIRNAMKTAISLAQYHCFMRCEASQTRMRPVLEVRWFQVVAQASWEFNAYLHRALDLDQMRYAKIKSLRDDRAYPGEEQLAMPPVPGGSLPVRPPRYEQQVAQQHQYSASQPSLFTVPGGLSSQNTMFGLPQQSFVSAQQANPYISPQSMTAVQSQQQQEQQPNAAMPSGGFPGFTMGNVTMPPMAPIPGAPQGAPIPTGISQLPPQQGQQQLFGHYGQYGSTNPQAQHVVPGSLQNTPTATSMFSGYSNPMASSSVHEQPPHLHSATQAPPQQTTERSSQPGTGEPQT